MHTSDDRTGGAREPGSGPPADPPVDPDVDLDVAAQRRELTTPRAGAVLAAIAVGGIAGAEARYGLGVVWPHPVTGWPWSTLVINTSGCGLIGVLMVLITERFSPHPLLRPLVGVGILGGYTTFSTFSADTVALAEGGAGQIALLNVAASVALALTATVLGGLVARALLGRAA